MAFIGLSIKFDDQATAQVEGIRSDARRAIRPAAHAGIQVMYDEARRLVPVKTGKLQRSIYQVYSVDQSSPQVAIYECSWNSRKAPHGWLVENGHVIKLKDGTVKHTTPVGFIRRAGDQAAAALDAASERFTEVMNSGAGTPDDEGNAV